ncbi:MAG: four helix bundle protein, partial [Bacteroidales bacterium]|nr:four helix bundle protein [Bacteroidales bacterium]
VGVPACQGILKMLSNLNLIHYFNAVLLCRIKNRCIMGNFQNLRVWRTAKDLTVEVYRLVRNTDIKRDFGFKDQIQRSALSIPSNIAEGDESGSDKMSVRHFYIAKGSTAELMTQLIIAFEIGYINSDFLTKYIDECDKISSMLNRLIKARSVNS